MRITKFILISLVGSLILLIAHSPASAQCGPDYYCSISANQEACIQMNGIPAACDLPGDLEGNCCRARAESGIDFDEFETFSTPRYVGGFTQVGTFIQIILPYIFAVAGIVLLVSIMISGFQLLVSGGDPKSVQVAKSRLTNSLLGFAAVIFAYFVVQLVGFILGLDGFGGVFSN